MTSGWIFWTATAGPRPSRGTKRRSAKAGGDAIAFCHRFPTFRPLPPSPSIPDLRDFFFTTTALPNPHPPSLGPAPRLVRGARVEWVVISARLRAVARLSAPRFCARFARWAQDGRDCAAGKCERARPPYESPDSRRIVNGTPCSPQSSYIVTVRPWRGIGTVMLLPGAGWMDRRSRKMGRRPASWACGGHPSGAVLAPVRPTPVPGGTQV